MNQPNIFIRFLGFLPLSLALFTAYAVVIYDWWNGPVPLLWALITAGLAYRTLRAVLRMRAYNAWSKNWQDLNAEVAGSGTTTNAGTRKPRSLLFPLAVFVGTPLLMAFVQNNQEALGVLGLIWIVDILCVASLLVARLSRTPKAIKVVREKVVEDKPVAWMLDRPSSSPDRAEVMKQLPHYVLQLMDRSQG